MPTAELKSWLRQPDLMTFPYGAVLREYHCVGKHFVSRELIDLLAAARARLSTMSGPWPRLRTLVSFLDTVLDKPDDRYDYSSYLALPLLQLPGADDPVEQAPFARARCDRITTQIVADALAFELAKAEGRTGLLPRMRPPAGLIRKRYKHGVRVMRPGLARMSLDSDLTATDPADLTRQACSAVRADMSVTERQALELSMLPVYTAHDEYLFLRVLQAFETTFSLLATHLRGVITALPRGEVDQAIGFLNASEAALHESAPLFSVLATMQVESFRTFRQFTEGASAIQSQNYKLVESLCRRPDPDRIDSAAYESTPDVRLRVLVGQTTLDEVYCYVRETGELSESDHRRLGKAMSGFAGALTRWRRTHYRLAVRMLGEATGTGYTEGTPYLKAVRDIPVFRAVDERARTR
ncbi:tryptophan 2,3-dioxygenase [Actinocrispum wychmicini]|uniref:Tryptophan 2,3-dioxygenase n=1 Tax=Actinocrispum wychmicini TaxID=1213861 RepID=A0A4R2JCD0_9PSEU|nr:tryptophan 2,3-dioxygenase [Actinocrispum wychmicini]TCO56087.1 tryptophan 2,3-dioxygenase [Actinocrispum wychmicini]